MQVHTQTHAYTVSRRQKNTEEKLPLLHKSVYLLLFFSLKEVDNSISWMFLITAARKDNDPEKLKRRSSSVSVTSRFRT